MPPSISRQHFKQAKLLLGIVGKKTAYATLLGAVFSYTDAYVENWRGQHDMASGAIAGAVTGTLFGLGRAMPQPFAWPLAFAATAVTADFIGELMPAYMKDFRCGQGARVCVCVRRGPGGAGGVCGGGEVTTQKHGGGEGA